jgi:uncharacterized RDD family membrane protein YckC
MQETMPSLGVAAFIIAFVMLMLVAVAVLTVIPFWKICTKAGFPGALSLLMLVPLGNLILPFYLAFAEWPALRQTQGSQSPAGPQFPR